LRETLPLSAGGRNGRSVSVESAIIMVLASDQLRPSEFTQHDRETLEPETSFIAGESIQSPFDIDALNHEIF
jgi:hypothetical protein